MILANMVWPALYLSQRYYTWWAIAIGLLIETGVLCWLTRKSPARCFFIAFIANTISAGVGYFAFIWIGLAWEFLVSYTIYLLIPVGTFNPFGWFATTALAALFSSTIEWGVIKYIFKTPTDRRFYWIFFLANLVTAGIALVSLFTSPIQL